MDTPVKATSRSVPVAAIRMPAAARATSVARSTGAAASLDFSGLRTAAGCSLLQGQGGDVEPGLERIARRALGILPVLGYHGTLRQAAP